MVDAGDAQAIAVRAATPGDVDRLLAIENASFATDRITRRSFRRQVGSPSLALLVATLGGAVHGYILIAFRARAHHARIYSLAVDMAQGRGLGRRLLEAGESLARERGYRLMRLEVNETNRRAIGIYERSGYLRIGRRDDYYEDGAAAFLYEKRLG